MDATTTAVKPWVLLVALGGIFYVGGQYIASQPQRVSQEQAANREIAVQGRGEVQSKPDIALLTLGVQTGPQASAAVALDLLGQRFTAVTRAVKDQGIKDDDMKTTNLNIQPIYDYTDGRQTIRGYEASESIEVKIRKLDTIGDVVAKATVEGVNQAGGVSFTIDDPSKLEQEAEAAAIADATQKAEALAKSLHVSLGRVKAFTTTNQPTPPQPYFAATALSQEKLAADVAAPPVQPGIQEVVANVTVTYELR